MEPSLRPDAELVADTLRQPQAYAELVERYTSRLLRYVRRLGCAYEQDAKDILQETFIKAYVHLREFDTALAFSSWIYRICHNETMSWFRKHVIRPHAAQTEEEALKIEELPDGRDVLEGINHGLNASHLLAAMEKLDQKYRDVLILRFFEERSYEEIADILEKPSGTIATLINRAKVQLRPHLHTLHL